MSIQRRASVGRRAAAIIVAALMVATIVPGTASAAGPGATVVRGVQHEYGSCGNGDGYLMDGALVGCWWVDTFVVEPLPAQATMLARGTEHFTGCLGSVCGTFFTTYTYTARFDGTTELHGRCHHPIVQGTGGFAGARGELSFTDVVDSEPFFYPYWGNIQLGREAQSLDQPGTTATRTSATVRAVSAPC
ncbi:MAG: hypothetical protein QOD78_1420 [Chloroflexota bacterium]|nr:hypothetical protein [Chloroflexota bacterium]